MAQRNQTSQVIINHYEQDVLDANGNPTGETVTSDRKIIVKANGLCYDAQDYAANPNAGPLWQLSAPEFSAASAQGVAFESQFGAAKLKIGANITAEYLLTYSINLRNRTYDLGLAIEGLGYYDLQQDRYVSLMSPLTP